MTALTRLLLLFAFLSCLLFVIATPVPDSTTATTTTTSSSSDRAFASFDALLANINLEIRAVGVTFAGQTGIGALRNYSTAVNGVIASNLAQCLIGSSCQTVVSTTAAAQSIAGIFTEVSARLDVFVGANGMLTWGGQILQMFTLPLIQGLLTLLDQVLDALGPGLGLQQLIDLIGPGGLADLLGLLGLGGLKTSA